MRQLVTVVVLLIACVAVAGAQIPDKFTNLKIIDSTISKDNLVALMRGMASSLGVRCDYCHVELPGDKGNDFASDSLPMKQIARDMMRMTGAINSDYIAKINQDSANRVDVRCLTCHRGSPKPLFIGDVLATAVSDGGADSAAALYLSLRDKFYGRAVYDFGAQPLSEFAMQLFRKSDQQGALKLQRLNTELNPKSSDAFFTLAQMSFDAADSVSGMRALDSSLALDPNNRRAAALKKSLDTSAAH